MKLYKVSQADLRFLGFSPSQLKQNFFCNRNKLLTFGVLGQCSVLTFVFLMCEAKVFVEYVESIYIFSAGVGSIVALATLRVKMMSKYIEAMENMINLSECIQLYSKTKSCPSFLLLKNRKIIGTDNSLRRNQSASGILGKNHIIYGHEGDSIDTLSLVVPSFFFYYTTGAKDSFLLPVPMWYV